MADKGKEREYNDNDGSVDPELIYTKEYCIGARWLVVAEPGPGWSGRTLASQADSVGSQAVAVSARSSKGQLVLLCSVCNC